MSKNFKRQFPNPKDLAPLLQFQLPTIHRKKRRLENALTIWDLREIAKRRTPKGPFDYTDGAAESEVSLERARQAFLDIQFHPNILHDVSGASLTRTSLGNTFDMPVGIAPTGFTRMMHSEGERAGSRAAEKFGIPFTLSTLGTTTIEDVVAAAPNGVNWFQLYMWKDREGSMALVDRAWKSGVKNLVLTVDVPVSGARLRDNRNGLTVPPRLNSKTVLNALPRPEWVWNFLTTPPINFASLSNWPGTVGELLDYMFDPTMTFEDLKWIRKQWKGTLTVKGIQTVEGISNLLTIFAALSGKSVAEIESEFDGKGYGDFKGAVADVVVDYLAPIREKTLELLNDRSHLESIMRTGAEKAAEVADQTLKATYDALGLIPRA